MDLALDAGNEHEPPGGRILRVGSEIELPVVQRDGERVIAEGRGAVDQRVSGMWNPIERIVRRMRVEFDLQHTGTPRSRVFTSSLFQSAIGSLECTIWPFDMTWT